MTESKVVCPQTRFKLPVVNCYTNKKSVGVCWNQPVGEFVGQAAGRYIYLIKTF